MTKIYKCNKCGMEFTDKKHFEVHKEVHKDKEKLE